MGTTAEKLNYLKETKTKIKNALETPSSIFRDYSSLIKKYIDNQPTKTVTNGVCGNAVDLPIKAINIDGNSYQETSSGKNKLDFKNFLKNANVTYTEQDGVFNLADNGNLYRVPYKLNLKPNTTYTIYQNFQKQNSTNVRLTIARGSNYENVVDSYSTSGAESYRKKTFTTDESSDYYIRSDWSTLKIPLIYNEPILVEGTNAMPYEPYTGGTPSPNPDYPQEITNVGENGIKIKQSGKNLFDDAKVSVMTLCSYSNGIYSASDNDTATTLIYKIQQFDSDRKYISSAGEVKQNIDKPGIYYFTAQKYTTTKYLRIGNNGATKEFQLFYPLDDINVGDYYTVVINMIDTTIGASKFKDVMLLKGKITSASYESYHEPIIIPINLQGNILSKVGDIKDILKVNRNGEVEIKKNIEKIVLTGEENLIDNSSTSTRKYWGIDFSNYGIYQYNDPTKVCDVLTTKFKSRPQQGIFLPGQVALTTNNKHMYFVFEPDTTEEQARAILKDMPVYFRLAEPQTIKLSSISPIELWQGINIFKLITNLDTTFEVEYVVDKESILNEVQTAMLEAEIEI